MRLDHLSYVAGREGLGACAQRIGGRLGAAFSDGGLHPAFGTRNFVLPLAGGCYLEVVAPLDHPAVDRAPFGRVVRRRSEEGGGWLGWAIAVSDLAPVEGRLGRSAAPGHRRRPDGYTLRWNQIGINDVSEDAQLPFFTQWQTPADEHPSRGGTIALIGLEIAGDEATVDAYLGTSSRQPLDGIDVQWVDSSDDDEHGVVAATFSTPSGEARID